MSKTIQVKVSGIKCGGCEKKIKENFEKIGVTNFEINRDEQSLKVTLEDGGPTTMNVVSKLNELGFPVDNFKTI